MARQSLSKGEARRVFLAAQGFCAPRPAKPGLGDLSRVIKRTGVLQIDSVNVLQRAHYMPAFSRLGPYNMDLIRQASEVKPRRMVEYWAHVAAYMPVELWPLMRHRMADHAVKGHAWFGKPGREDLADSLLADIADRGACTSRQLDDGLPVAKENWGWNWSQTRIALECMFMEGRVAVAGRNSQFERMFDLPERVLPRKVLEAPTPSRPEANLELVRLSMQSLGVASEACLRNYYRLKTWDVAPAVRSLVESGEITPVAVEGWSRQAYLWHGAKCPRSVPARALLSPFDPVVWERDRNEALFDFFYRIEIYTPAHKRVHGYYVLPFLLGDQLVARVDLKANRKTGTLEVISAFSQEGSPVETASELAVSLRELAMWLGLAEVSVGRVGDLATGLAFEVAKFC